MAVSANAFGRDRAAFAAAFFLSAFGYEVLFFAMTLRVYDISRRAINVGVFTAITFLPKLLSPAYGVLVDRFGPRRIIALAASATALLALGLTLVDSLMSLYAIWLILSVLFVTLSNARTVLMTRVARSGGYIGGNAVAFSLLNAARLAAPLCAALLSGALGTGGLMVIAAGVYGLCAGSAALFTIEKGLGANGEGPGGAKGAFFVRLGEGFALIRAPGRLRSLVGVSCIRNFFLGFLPSLLIIVVTDRLGGTKAEYGVALTAAALGSLGGSLAGPLIAKAAPRRAVGGAGLALHFACIGLLGVVGSYAAALVALVVGHFALCAAAVVLHSMRDESIEPDMKGRAYGANTTVQTIPNLISMLVGSALADLVGVGPVFAASGLAALAVLAAVSIRVSRIG